jgi:hypothetical protein
MLHVPAKSRQLSKGANMQIKRSLLIAAAATTVAAGGVGTLGLASAAASSTDSQTSLVDQIATRFHLNKSDVQSVFDQDRQQHEADREAKQKQALADAVTNGKLTQDQADHITQVLNEVKSLRGTTAPKDLSDDTRSQIKADLDGLRTWAKQNNIDLKYIMPGPGGRGHGGPGGQGGSMGAPDSSNLPRSNSAN